MATTLFLSGVRGRARSTSWRRVIERGGDGAGADEMTLDELHRLVEGVLGREDGEGMRGPVPRPGSRCCTATVRWCC